MQIILASAKIMNSHTEVAHPRTSVPLFLNKAQEMALEMSVMDVNDLRNELHCNDKIVIENKLRYQDFFNEKAALPALLAYHGQAYKCLKAETFSIKDMDYAQKHLLITSFLYGLLRPLDSIHPYRMEGKVKLKDAKTRFDYWKPLLTDILIDRAKKDDGILIHLATEEFQHLFDWKRVEREIHIIQPLFMVDKDDKLKAVSVYAKSCRGAMASYIIKNRIKSPEELLSFEYKGFTYRPGYGDKEHPHFILE